MIPHNRGRGGYPHIGGRGRGQYPLIQHGSNRLIAKNVSLSSVSSSSVPIPGDPLYEDFQKYLKEKGINNPPSYTQAITEVSPKYKEAITLTKGSKEVIEVISSLHFFIEFSIPWIWKWFPQVDYSPNKFSSLQRLYLTKLWPKMLQRDQETKELNSKQTVDHINQNIQQYKAQMEFSNTEKNQDNYFKRIAEELNISDQQMILNTVKTEDIIAISKAVYTLMVNIIEHFTGRWSDNYENIRSLLNRLRCRTLTSFRWYKDTFLSRVMELRDCNSVYWKSKFIDGLPNLFADKVKKQLRNSNSIIPFEEYAYRKLKPLNQRENRNNYLKNIKNLKIINIINKRNYFSKKDNYDNKKSQNPPTCWKCGKVGYFANKCRMKKKINNLNIDEKMKSQIMNILLNTSSDNLDTSEEEIHDSDIESETDNEN
ncbi:hypothetical protein LXL04_015562 [Taraxacum kok-saghyz]